MAGRGRRTANGGRALAVVLVGIVVPLTSLLASPAHAATTGSIYSYSLSGVSTATVSNRAVSNPSTSLTLRGTWSPSSVGVHFAGSTVSGQSVGYAKPSSGYTLNAPATHALGVIVKFRYESPSSGSCFKDSRNVTQIGRFGAGLSQLKVQLSSCSGTTAGVFPECRMVGSHSTTSDLPRRATQALVHGATYVVRCYKGPDPSSGTTTLTLRTTRIDATAGNVSTTNTFAITRPGAMTSTEYLSVANKYLLPKQSSNTDQFVGDVAKVAYCQATTLTTVTTCLSTEVPES